MSCNDWHGFCLASCFRPLTEKTYHRDFQSQATTGEKVSCPIRYAPNTYKHLLRLVRLYVEDITQCWILFFNAPFGSNQSLWTWHGKKLQTGAPLRDSSAIGTLQSSHHVWLNHGEQCVSSGKACLHISFFQYSVQCDRSWFKMYHVCELSRFPPQLPSQSRHRDEGHHGGTFCLAARGKTLLSAPSA